jgi:hypothetical protein
VKRFIHLLLIAWIATAIPRGLLVAADARPSRVPGVVIFHSPRPSGIYLGSPGIAVLPDGTYLAKCDEFGPGSTELSRAITRVFSSTNHGLSWSRRSVVEGMFWASLFEHRRAVYLLGTDRQNGNAVIRRSDDGGRTWTAAVDRDTGLLISDGRYHCAPVPLIVHRGRLWRAMEDAMGPDGWGRHFHAFMLSAPVEADLLKAESWTASNRIGRDPAWLNGDFGGWLEGNAVVTRDGRVLDVLRVDTSAYPEKAAFIEVSDDGRNARFDPQTGFVDFPGGAKKFTIRFDPPSDLYWSLVNFVPDASRDNRRPASVRNTLALAASPDLKKWSIRAKLLQHPDPVRHGFQYVDWLFEGEDIIAVCRTAYDDEQGGANNYHDANYLTFHRVPKFRSRKEE